jgi:hypothetical protein
VAVDDIPLKGSLLCAVVFCVFSGGMFSGGKMDSDDYQLQQGFPAPTI